LWEKFEADVLFIIGEHRNNEAKLLGKILEELQEPVVLTVPLADSTNLQRLYKSLGFTLIPGRWTDQNEREYEVYVKGQMNMGGYVNLMERVENIGSCVVAVRRPVPVVFFSFFAFLLSKVFG
jgi:hypothetical protein